MSLGYSPDYAAEHGRFAVVPAAYVILLREGDDGASDGSGDGSGGTEALLQLRRGTGYMDGHWAAAAAGHVERGETAYDAAHREAREEIGVEDLSLDFVTAMQRTRHDRPIDERIDFFFTARTWTGEPRVREPAKSAGLRWCPLSRLDTLPEPVVPHERTVLDALAAGSLDPLTSFGF